MYIIRFLLFLFYFFLFIFFLKIILGDVCMMYDVYVYIYAFDTLNSNSIYS